MTDAITLDYGRNYGVPAVTTAWGARAILNDQWLDLVGDRMHAAGPLKDDLLAYLKETFPDLDRKVVSMRFDPTSDELRTVFEDETAIVVASTNASYGYLYLRAWFKADEITDVPNIFADAVQVDHLTDEQVEQVSEILDKLDD